MALMPSSPSKQAQSRTGGIQEKVEFLLWPDVDLTTTSKGVETFSAVLRLMNDFITRYNAENDEQRPLITERQLLAATPAAVLAVALRLHTITKQGAISRAVQTQVFTAIFRRDPIVKVEGEHGRQYNELTDDSTRDSRTRFAGLVTPRVISILDECNRSDKKATFNPLHIDTEKTTVAQYFLYVGSNIHADICEEKTKLADEAAKSNSAEKDSFEKSAAIWTGSKTPGSMRLHLDREDLSSKDKRYTTGKRFSHLNISKDALSVDLPNDLNEDEKADVAEIVRDAFSLFYADNDGTDLPDLIEARIGQEPQATDSSSSSSAAVGAPSIDASSSSSSSSSSDTLPFDAFISSSSSSNAGVEMIDVEDVEGPAMTAAFENLTSGRDDKEGLIEIGPAPDASWYVPKIGSKSSKAMPTHYPNGLPIPRMNPSSSRLYLGDSTHPVCHIDTPEGCTLTALNALLGVTSVTIDILGFKVPFFISHCPGSPHPDFFRLATQSKEFVTFIDVVESVDDGEFDDFMVEGGGGGGIDKGKGF